MKKVLFTSILSSTVLLTACGSDDANGDADSNDQETPTEENATEKNESDTNGENSMTGEDVLNEAIASMMMLLVYTLFAKVRLIKTSACRMMKMLVMLKLK